MGAKVLDLNFGIKFFVVVFLHVFKGVFAHTIKRGLHEKCPENST